MHPSRPFSDAREAEADGAACLRHASAVVTHPEDEVVAERDSDRRALGARVPKDIVECFLDDAIRGQLEIGGKTHDGATHSQGDGDLTALLDRLGQLSVSYTHLTLPTKRIVSIS